MRSAVLVRLVSFVLVAFCVGFVGVVVGRSLGGGCCPVLDRWGRRWGHDGLRGGWHYQGVCFLSLRIGWGLFGDGGRLG